MKNMRTHTHFCICMHIHRKCWQYSENANGYDCGAILLVAFFLLLPSPFLRALEMAQQVKAITVRPDA